MSLYHHPDSYTALLDPVRINPHSFQQHTCMGAGHLIIVHYQYFEIVPAADFRFVRFLRDLQGQLYRKSGSLPLFTFYPDFTAQQANQILRNGHAQTSAPIFPGYGAVFLLKGSKKMLQEFFTHANTAVLHKKGQLCMSIFHRCLTDHQANDASCRCELYGI